ncbi:hypothetical protein JXA02_08570 [candidate division KSB1 bacterium]|nr:hypothetical protein [candidate division KSB1 bacterium]RQW05290.1 MAG: hypothetical protein EH222_10135 [candidate division KSB1 bacterium]
MARTLFTACLCLLNLSCAVAAADARYRIRETNRAYEQGDWMTVGATRFVRYVSIGHTFVYFSTTGGITRLNRFSYKWDFPWTTSNGLPDNDVFLAAMDMNTGFLWAVTKEGISYLEPASQMWRSAFYNEMGMGDQYITSVGFGTDRQVYVVTSDNLWYVSDNVSAQFQEMTPPLSDEFINWHGAREQKSHSLPNFFMDGGFLFDSRQRYIDDLQFRHWQITTWIKDDWNNVWLGTWGLGAARGDLNTIRLELLDFGLWDEVVDDIEMDNDAYWLAGVQEHDEPTGVTEWHGLLAKPVYYEPRLITGFASEEITSIAADARAVWFGTRNGLVRFDKRKNMWRTYNISHGIRNSLINKVMLDDHFLWLATDSGIDRIDLATVGTDSMRITALKFPTHRLVRVFDIAQQDDLLWLATEFGLFKYDKLSGDGGYYSGLDENLVSRPIFAVSAWGEELWFGSDWGVYGFNAMTDEWLAPLAKEYRTDAGINRILASHQAIWVATDAGVLKFDKRMQRWRQFTELDGLADDRVYAIELDGDYIYFGTARGLTRFYWNNPFRND